MKTIKIIQNAIKIYIFVIATCTRIKEKNISYFSLGGASSSLGILLSSKDFVPYIFEED